MFAAIGRVRYAIIALAAIVFMTWLNYMPSVVRHGFDFGGIGTCGCFIEELNLCREARMRAGLFVSLLAALR